jgi:hypothetical protein
MKWRYTLAKTIFMQFDMRGRKKCVRRAVDFIATLFLTVNIRTSTMSTTRIAK